MMTVEATARPSGGARDYGRDPELLAAARELRPQIAERGAEIEGDRHLPTDIVELLRDRGFFHLLLPESLGGLECDPVTASQIVEEVSVADGSAGWCVMIAAQNAALAGYLPEADAQAVWGNGQVVAGTARPIGRALRTDSPADGFLISGRWPFASGSSHADYFAAECVVYDEDGDEPRRDASGEAVTRMVFVPREAVTIHDTWDTTGLRGTASNDFGIDGAFVPASRGFQMIVDPPVHPWPLYRALALVFMTHGAQALGVARAAIEGATALVLAKRGWGNVPLSEVPRMQSDIAHATALVHGARAYMYGEAAELWSRLEAGATDDDVAALRSHVRLATSHAASVSVQAVDLLHGALATSSIFTGSPLERPMRDIHTAAAHVMIGPMTYEAAGRVELGLDAAFPFF